MKTATIKSALLIGAACFTTTFTPALARNSSQNAMNMMAMQMYMQQVQQNQLNGQLVAQQQQLQAQEEWQQRCLESQQQQAAIRSCGWGGQLGTYLRYR